MDSYFIGYDLDGYSHIYKRNADEFARSYSPAQPQELSWQGLTVTVRPRHFYKWIEKPREIGDEFEMFGQKWVVVDYWYESDQLECAIANAVGYRLLLHKLIWRTEMRVMLREWWASIPMCIWDVINRDPQLDKDIIDLKKQFRAERDAPFIYYS